MPTSLSTHQSPRANHFSFKVDRATSVDEIKVLESVGVDYIGFDADDDAYYRIDPDPFWGDERYISEDDLPELLAAVRRAQPYVDCSPETLVPELVEQRAASGVHLLQITARFPPESPVVAACEALDVGLIYGHDYVVPEDKPSFKDTSAAQRPCLRYYDLQVFPSERNAWWYLKEFSPEHPRDVITVDDIQAVAARVPLFVSLNVNPSNVREIVDTLSAIGVAGLSFTLSPTKYGSFHTFELEEVVESLRALEQAPAH